MGLRIGGHCVALDKHEAESDLNFVSHAHSDHISGIRKNKGTIASEITKALVESRGRRFTMAAALPGTRLLSAGHMLGSRQFYVESELSGYSVVYTGDYLMQKTYASEEIEIRKADILIMDSTYPNPNVVFDERSEVISAIQCYVKQKLNWGIVLFGAYSMGKAQELIRIFNEIGIAPVVDEKTGNVNRIYDSFGVRLDYEVAGTGAWPKGNFVGIVNVQKLTQEKLALQGRTCRRVFTAVATGWAKVVTFETDVQFPLSDHADFRQALQYIERCEPKIVYTVGQQAGMLAHNLNRAGQRASPFSDRALAEQAIRTILNKA